LCDDNLMILWTVAIICVALVIMIGQIAHYSYKAKELPHTFRLQELQIAADERLMKPPPDETAVALVKAQTSHVEAETQLTHERRMTAISRRQ